ncbi:MAG TPA: beta-ketoacyl synthase N-terminal-like domain-containing protein, partial [Gammaproteobacteria bacterium]|nr:beta-ketoacyl synthase N-terminal-like domain-containing protein [Gammaproteobacteria bacterium]
MSRRRVVVTGLGIVSPVGSTVAKAWENILAGRSGIRRIEAFDASNFSVQISGSVRDFNADDYISPKEQKKMDPFIHYGIGAGVQAINDAALEVTEANSTRVGVAIGSGIGGLPGIERNY